MKKLVVLFAALAIVSCKDEKAAQPEAAKPAEEQNFKVVLDVVMKKDDALHIYYTEDGSINFTEENSVWAEVKGAETSQKVTFNLPEEVIPSQLRIDFGWAKDQGEIVINSCEFKYYGKSWMVPGADFFKYFRPNEGNTIVNPANNSVKSLPNDGKVGPSAYPMETLAPELKKLTGN